MKFSISYLVNCGLVAAGPDSYLIPLATSCGHQLKNYLVRQTFVDLSHGFLSNTKQDKPWGYIYTHEDCPIGKYSLHLISPEKIFLNFENDDDYFYEDGTSFNKKYFEDIEWDLTTRNLKGKISWPSENMFWNDKEWKFDLIFAPDFNTVERGTETWIDANGEQIEIPYNAGDYKLASNFNIDIK